jgi:hypothetical protein
MYSRMLYMKTRVTFRVETDLADALRDLPNQTRFVEDALRDALGRTCPACHGSGRQPLRRIGVSNVRAQGIRRLSRDEALQLQKVFRLGQEVAATRIDLARLGRRVSYTMRRETTELLNGVLSPQNGN